MAFFVSTNSTQISCFSSEHCDLHRIGPNSVVLILPTFKLRALCVDWSKDGKEIVAGYADSCFRKWTLLSQLNSNLTIGTMLCFCL